ncbi:DUF4129 domain-containing protein [Nocardia sp. 004]|uniref:DUF4129 domain-containing protein n=1 Tax=Nocardia sp. 004 TaxID=3385978 RepID=UPI0039A22D3E
MIVLIALLACAVVTLRGYIPGIIESGPGQRTPSALSVALMPVLLTVSTVILLAGVLASQHRLPLAMPEPRHDDEYRRGRLGRVGLAVLGALMLLALLLATVVAIYFIAPGRSSEPAPPASPVATTEAPPEPGSATSAEPSAQSPELHGAALLLAGIVAAGLLSVAATGVVVVAMSSRRSPIPAPAPPDPAVPTEVDSLARAAELGLAAMNAPGQDARTAIIACYLAMEHGLAFDHSTAPLISDTPMEVLARAFERGALRDASARELVALFEEARFSPHAMLEWQRMRAEQLLRIVLADLRERVPA